MFLCVFNFWGIIWHLQTQSHITVYISPFDILSEYTHDQCDVAGNIFVSDNLERDPVMSEYVIQIEAIDGGLSRLSSTTQVTIKIPFNNPPQILLNSTQLKVKENEPSHTVIGLVNAQDDDMNNGNNEKLTFFIMDQEGMCWFFWWYVFKI